MAILGCNAILPFQNNASANTIQGTKFQASANGNITDIQAYLIRGNISYCIYDDITKNRIAEFKSHANTSGWSWETEAIVSAIISGNWYWLCWVQQTSDPWYKSDEAGISLRTASGVIYPNTPLSIAGMSTIVKRYSIYCNFTPGGATEQIYDISKGYRCMR